MNLRGIQFGECCNVGVVIQLYLYELVIDYRPIRGVQLIDLAVVVVTIVVVKKIVVDLIE